MRGDYRTWYAENRVLIWVCALIAVNQLGFGTIIPAIPLYARTFDVPRSAIGLTIAIYGLARFLFNLPAGQLADRFGRRNALALGGLLTAVGSLLSALAPEYWSFVVARFLSGAGAAFVSTTCQIILADISRQEQRGRMMATYMSVFLFAVGIGPIPGGFMIERYGLPSPFYAFTILAMLAVGLAWFRVPETRGSRPGGGLLAPRKLPPLSDQLRAMTSQPGFLLISLLSFSTFFARTGALFTLIPLLGQERLALGADRIGLGLGLISITGLLLTYPAGVLVDRFGRKMVIVPATLLTGVSFLLFLIAGSELGFMVGCLVWGMASGISGATPSAYAADMAPSGMNAVALSSFRMLSDLGYIAGPLLAGLTSDLFGMDAALASTAGLVMLAAALFGIFAPETHRPRPAPV